MKHLAYVGILISIGGLWGLVWLYPTTHSESNNTLAQTSPSKSELSFKIASTSSSSQNQSDQATTSATTDVDSETSTPEPATPPPLPPGATRQPTGGIARTNCDAITGPEIQTVCQQEQTIARYIYSIVPNAQITKGFCWPGTSYADPKNWNQCTDLNNLETNTVHALQDIFEQIVAHCARQAISDCAIIITGGSELGHRGERVNSDGSITCVDTESHCGGKKIDLRLTKGLESLITSTFIQLPNRNFDQAPQWRDPKSGNIYAREPTHWDILVP